MRNGCALRPQTTESGRLHGMPLAVPLGHGDETLTGIAGGARPRPQACVPDRRPHFEAGEAALLAPARVRISPMREVRQRGSTPPCAQPAKSLRPTARLWEFRSISMHRGPVEAPASARRYVAD